MENKTPSNKDNLKGALCYIPLVGIVLFFTEDKKSSVLLKHIKYGTVLFLAYVVIKSFFTLIFGYKLGFVLFLIYAGIAFYFGYKANKGEDVNIEYIEKMEKKVKDKLNEDAIKDNEFPEEKEEKEVKPTSNNIVVDGIAKTAAAGFVKNKEDQRLKDEFDEGDTKEESGDDKKNKNEDILDF